MIPALRQGQAGIAALTAILVVAIATVLAVNLLWQSSVDLRRTETLLLQDQARQYDLGGEEFAKFGLAQDYRDDGAGGGDSLQENWAKPLTFAVEGGKLEGKLEDQQGRFNLNGLIGADGKPVAAVADQYERLLLLLPLERPLDPGTARALVEATVDWLDPDPYPQLDGAEDDEYTSRTPSYRPANFWFTSPSELLAVKGYTAEILQWLLPNVTALPMLSPPAPWKLNVNTATPLVLASLLPNISGKDVEPFLNGDYKDANDFIADFPGGENIPKAQIPLDIGSNWFLLTVTASIGTAQSTMYSLLERNGETVRTRRRTFDVY
ncbi:MAG: type II secretion system minor pseudopilin GspK [Gammaproteobacteria bacterium]